MNSTVANALSLSYDGESYCGASIAATFQTLPAPDVSYFQEVGQVAAYDSKVSAYDGKITNSALSGAQIMLGTELDNAKWEALATLGASIAIGGGVGAIVSSSLSIIAPFTFRVIASTTGQFAADLTDAAIGTGVADIAGAAAIIAVFVEIGVEAAIDLSQSIQNQNAINAMLATANTIGSQTPDLKAMLQDQVGYQQVVETFIAATLPDTVQTHGAPTLPAVPPATPATDVFYITNHTSNNQTSVSNFFNYTTWDPSFPAYPGNPPYAQYGTSLNAYPFEFGFIQTVEQGTTSYTFFSPTIRFIDPNTGIHYSADLIDKGRFLVSKAADQIGNNDYDCPADPVSGLTQSPGTQIPTICKSFVMNTLNIYGNDYYNTTIQIPQAPVFVTPNATDFSTAGTTQSFYPQIDSTTQGLPCSIRATGTLPPGLTYSNGALYVNEPFASVPGTYQFNFVADCETLGLGTPFVNYTFGTATTTQAFTANVYQAPGSSSEAAPAIRDTAYRLSGHTAGPTALQFVYPASSTNLTFIRGRSTKLLVETNGGPGTSIAAGQNALPAGMTLADNGNGTATISGIPTGATQSCSSNCAITASAPGLPGASLTLNYTVVLPVLPTIPASQNITWNAGQSNTFTIDGSAGSSGMPTQVPLTWSVVGTLPSWASFLDNGNNIAIVSGIPPVSLTGQTVPIKVEYSYGGVPGFSLQHLHWRSQ